MLNKILFVSSLSLAFSPAAPAASDLIITGVIDGPLSGGTPKAIELYAQAAIADLGIYGVGLANNGGGSDGEEFTLAGSVGAGSYLYITKDELEFAQFFGFAPSFVNQVAGGNGDDAVELFMSGAVVDTFGEVDADGTGQPWEYLDSWAYRLNQTGPDGAAFELSNWSFGAVNALDGETANTGAASPFPLGTYQPAVVPLPAAAWLFGSAVFGLIPLTRRRA